MHMKYFYVYKISLLETGEYYFGSRKCSVLPEKDIHYMGSMCAWKPDKSKLIKEILFTNFSTHKEALEKEAELILEHWKNPLNKNYALPNGILYTHSPKEWILKKYGIKEGNRIFQEINENNSSIWRKGHQPWNTGKTLSEEHLENIRKTWHSEKRMKVMQSEEYKNNMSNSLSGEKNPMFNKTIYEVWHIKYGKEIADKKLEEWHKNKKGQKAWNKGLKRHTKKNLQNE
jgi:NUMOD3 motif